MLCAFIEGDLDATGKAQIEKHLKDNPQHKKLLQELTAMRDLVRNLPRVRAPIDVGDSLRQKVERSLLLDDSAALVPERSGASRWPQFFGIAAVVLLFASLGFIVFKAISPTLKPAVITQSEAMMPMQEAEPMAQALSKVSPLVSTAKEMAAPGPDGSRLVQGLVPAPQANFLRSLQQLQAQNATPAQPNINVIRKRLADFGYDIHAPEGSVLTAGNDGGQPGPILMVVNTSDPLATKVQIAQFLSNSSGVSWNVVPAAAQAPAGATTLPSTGAPAVANNSIATPVAAGSLAGAGASSVNGSATTQPSAPQDLYVAHGLNAEKADALRQSLIVPQNGSQVQVTMQSALSLVTTRPSDLSSGQAAVNSTKLTGEPSTQPAQAANAAVALAQPAAVTPMIAAQTPADANANSPGSGAPVLHEVDTVIVLNPVEMLPSDVIAPPPAAPAESITTQPTLENAPLQNLSPTTQPASATTQP